MKLAASELNENIEKNEITIRSRTSSNLAKYNKTYTIPLLPLPAPPKGERADRPGQDGFDAGRPKRVRFNDHVQVKSELSTVDEIIELDSLQSRFHNFIHIIQSIQNRVPRTQTFLSVDIQTYTSRNVDTDTDPETHTN